MSSLNTRPPLPFANGATGDGAQTIQPGSLSDSRMARKAMPTVGSRTLYRHVTLFDLGRQRAIDGHALQQNETDLAVLREEATAMAKETRREPYDPKNRHEDRMREQEFQKHQSDRAQVEDALKFSGAEVREKEEALARLPRTAKPTVPIWLMVAFTVGIGATITPTLHDFLFANFDESLVAWLLAMASAGFLAGVIVWGILGSIDATGHRNTANWVGFAGGITVSVAFGLLRCAGAMGTEEMVLALALTLVEIGLVIIADWVASGLRHQFVEWKERQSAWDQASSALEAAITEHRRRQERLDEIQTQIENHIHYVEDRNLASSNLADLIDAAVKAVTNGYYDGIAYNRRITVGAGGAR